MNIHGYQSVSALSQAKPMPQTDKTAKGGDNFASLLHGYINQVNHDDKAAGKAAVALASGDSKNTSETLLAIQKADLSFQLMMSVRNKLVSAYREISRMQV